MLAPMMPPPIITTSVRSGSVNFGVRGMKPALCCVVKLITGKLEMGSVSTYILGSGGVLLPWERLAVRIQ